ncbi:MAG: PAS domain S-box protein [Chitinophagaceae bacterium]|nr:PAS domain S-box protein [Chitinophagaceae bacterium]
MHTLELPYQVEAFFELTPDFVCIAGKDGYFKNINHAVVTGLGFTKEELMASPISSFMHPDDVQHTIEQRKELFKGNALLNFENRYITKNGTVVWLQWTSTYFAEWEIVFAIAKDITLRKKAEQQVADEFAAFKSLALDFKSRMEEDRKYLATELHEELAQLASVIKMNIDWVQRNENHLSETTKSRLEHSAVITDLLINTIRRLSYKLTRPS